MALMASTRRAGADRWNVRTAFTLVELLAAVAIVGLLVAVAVPAMNGVRERAMASKCLSNLRQIGAGLTAYLADHDQQMPVLEAGRASRTADGDTIDTVLLDYVGSEAAFACPADSRYARETGTSYYWNVTLNGQRVTSLNFLGIEEAHTRIPVISDKEGWHPGDRTKVNILYADGHAGKGLTLTTGN